MRCWTCESKLEGPPKILGGTRQMFTCHTCTGLIELGRIREKIETSQAQSLGDALRLFEESTRGPQEIVSAIEWGFEDIGWNLDQMTGVLKSIDTTLKTPSLIKANEWRQMAEELRRRGVLDESEEFFLKSLRANPLDYRTYIGLGKTYLQMEKSDLARTYWEKSLPHAPEEEIDYKSYSYRLIGRIYFCEENYQQAALALKKAIELSPRYYPGHYDYAQYCALIGDKKNCLSSLKIAVEKEPLPLGLVRQERNLQVFKKEIENLLRTVDPNELNFRERLKRELQKDPLWYVPEEVQKEILKSERNLEIFNEVVDDLGFKELKCTRAEICLEAQGERKLEEAKKTISNLYGEENVNEILSVVHLCYHNHGVDGRTYTPYQDYFNALKNILCESFVFYAKAASVQERDKCKCRLEDIRDDAQKAIEAAEKEAQLSDKELGRIIKNSIKNARKILKKLDRDHVLVGQNCSYWQRLNMTIITDDTLMDTTQVVEGIAKKQIMAPNSGLVLQKAQNKKETEEEEEKRRRKRRHIKRLRRGSSLYRCR